MEEKFRAFVAALKSDWRFQVGAALVVAAVITAFAVATSGGK